MNNNLVMVSLYLAVHVCVCSFINRKKGLTYAYILGWRPCAHASNDENKIKPNDVYRLQNDLKHFVRVIPVLMIMCKRARVSQ